MAFELTAKPERSCKGVTGADVSFLFQPDTIIPLQFSEMHRRNIYMQSEKRLMLGVLEDTIACFQKYHSTPCKKGKTLFREVEEWFCSKDDNWLFSFENICHTLAINSDYFRRGLLEWKEKQPVSQQSGPRKGTKRFGNKAGVLSELETHRVSAIAEHEGDRLETLETDFDYLSPLTQVEMNKLVRYQS